MSVHYFGSVRNPDDSFTDAQFVVASGVPHLTVAQKVEPYYFGDPFLSPIACFPVPFPKALVGGAHWQAKTWKVNGSVSGDYGEGPITESYTDQEMVVVEPSPRIDFDNGEKLSYLCRQEKVQQWHEGFTDYTIVDMYWGQVGVAPLECYHDAAGLKGVFADLWIDGDGKYWPRLVIEVWVGLDVALTTSRTDTFSELDSYVTVMGVPVPLYKAPGEPATTTDLAIDINETFDYSA